MTATCYAATHGGADTHPLADDLAQLLESAERIRIGIATLRRRSLVNVITQQSNAEWLAAYDAAGGPV